MVILIMAALQWAENTQHMHFPLKSFHLFAPIQEEFYHFCLQNYFLNYTVLATMEVSQCCRIWKYWLAPRDWCRSSPCKMEFHWCFTSNTLLILSLPLVQLTAHFSLEDKTVWAGESTNIKTKVEEKTHNFEISINKKHLIYRTS